MVHVSEGHKVSAWPVAILDDRYGGAYSGGAWLAIANADINAPPDVTASEINRVAWLFESDAYSDDTNAGEFWRGPAKDIPWLAVGETPNAALENLYDKLYKAEHP